MACALYSPNLETAGSSPDETIGLSVRPSWTAGENAL